MFRDSGFSGFVESVSPITETPIKEYIELKEPFKRLTANNNFEIGTHSKIIMFIINNIYQIKCIFKFICYSDNYPTSAIGVDRHFKIKKNKSDVESLLKEEVINCSCGSNQEDGLMIQVILIYYYI